MRRPRLAATNEPPPLSSGLADRGPAAVKAIPSRKNTAQNKLFFAIFCPDLIRDRPWCAVVEGPTDAACHRRIARSIEKPSMNIVRPFNRRPTSCSPSHTISHATRGFGPFDDDFDPFEDDEETDVLLPLE